MKGLSRKLTEHEVRNGQKVLVDIAEEAPYLGKLSVVRSENLRRARKVVDNCDRQNLYGHLLLDFSTRPLIPVRLVELGDCVFVFICVLPPLRAELTHISMGVLLEAICELRQLFVDLNQVLKVELHVFVQFLALLACLLCLDGGLRSCYKIAIGLRRVTLFTDVSLVADLFDLGLMMTS